jgi:hypothetical protein
MEAVGWIILAVVLAVFFAVGIPWLKRRSQSK